MSDEPDVELEACVTHWRVYRAWRREPYAVFGFHLCPVEDGTEHEVVNFISLTSSVASASPGVSAPPTLPTLSRRGRSG
jgi:hypothetical protein